MPFKKAGTRTWRGVQSCGQVKQKSKKSYRSSPNITVSATVILSGQIRVDEAVFTFKRSVRNDTVATGYSYACYHVNQIDGYILLHEAVDKE